jgi:Matrixin
MKRGQVIGAAAGLAFALLAAPRAHAFCRTTTCDPNKPSDHCVLDPNACIVTGKQLAWRSSCVTIGVQQMGSPLNGLGYDDIAPIVEQAFGAWLQADCGNATPSIDVKLLGPIECGVSEYNSDVGNANIVIFREDEWPYIGAANAIGLTTTRFDTKNGDLWDADIELNGVGAQLSIGDPITGDDLLSVLTHEAGHFLGLSHSNDAKATMRPIYDPVRDGTDFRSLAQDDIDGICAVYPPARQAATASCDNRHGFSAQCGADQPAPNESKGCSLNTRTATASATVGSPSSYASLLALLAAAVGARRARRRRLPCATSGHRVA